MLVRVSLSKWGNLQSHLGQVLLYSRLDSKFQVASLHHCYYFVNYNSGGGFQETGNLPIIQGGSNMTGTDLYVNKPHCASAVRP